MSLTWEKWKPWIINGFWVLILAIAFIAMQKAMHPGWEIFGY